MKRSYLAGMALVLFVVVLGSLSALAQDSAGTSGADVSTAAAPADSQVERGRYLVHEVAMCVQCHSPRNRSGDLDESRLLTGGAIPFENPWSGGRRWAFQAPNLRNALGYTETEWIHFLGTGIRKSGDMPRLPMPPYRMSAEDASAIYAYLQSL